MKKTIAIILISIALIAIGFFIGRLTVNGKTEVKTEYVELPAVRDTIFKPKYVKVKETDTVLITKVDTITLINECRELRHYSETLFDCDTLGRLDVEIDVQFNDISNLGYTFIPLQQRSIVKTPKINVISPFVGIGAMSDKSLNVQGGIFIKEKVGINAVVQYNFDTKKPAIGAGLFYKW